MQHEREDKSCVALIGMRGSGKSTVGAELAGLLGGAVIDTDVLISEEAGRSISDIFRDKGETAFRACERAAVAQAARLRPAVISVGGGAVLDPRNVDVLRNVAWIIWLTAPAEVLLDRVALDPASAVSRPALTDNADGDEIRKLLAERSPVYEHTADVIIATEHRSPREIAVEIVRQLATLRLS